MYRPMVAMEVTAEKATLLFSMGRPSRKVHVTCARHRYIQDPGKPHIVDDSSVYNLAV